MFSRRFSLRDCYNKDNVSCIRSVIVLSSPHFGHFGLIVVILVFLSRVMRASLNKQEKQLLESWHWLKRRDQLIQVGSVTLNACEIEQLDYPS